MILPIVAYGHPVLKKAAEEVDADYPDLKQFIEDMYETLYASSGVGLAAPQVNKSIRIFVVDADPLSKEYPEAKGYKKTFVNPEILEYFGNDFEYCEGCLSLPGLYEDVIRKSKIRIRYQDENFDEHEEIIEGIPARIVQHEYDHLDGIVYTEHLSNMKKILIKGKLRDISEGKVAVDYRMAFPNKRRKR